MKTYRIEISNRGICFYVINRQLFDVYAAETLASIYATSEDEVLIMEVVSTYNLHRPLR